MDEESIAAFEVAQNACNDAATQLQQAKSTDSGPEVLVLKQELGRLQVWGFG